jgi:hypothetical protein
MPANGADVLGTIRRMDHEQDPIRAQQIIALRQAEDFLQTG